MADQKQNPLVIAGLIVVIVVALTFVVKTAIPKRYRPPNVDWTCETCGYQFIETAGTSPSKCPECDEMEAVRTVYYECGKCDNVFEIYRRKMPALATPKEGPETMSPEMMEGLIKKPDGEWVKEMSEEGMKIMEKLSCLKCGNEDRALLKYSSPASK